MMAASSSSSNLSDHLVQDDHLPWPASSSSSLLPFAPAPHHSAIIGGNQLWCQQPLTLNCADRHHSDELEVLLSAQGGGGGHHQSHSHSSSHPSAVIPHLPPQLSSLLMMQDLGFQWSNCGGSFLDTSSPSMAPMNNGHHQHDNGHDDNVKEEDPLIVNSSGSSCASTAIACHDDIVLDGGGGGGGRLPTMAAVAVATDLDGGATTVLPSVNISRPATMTTTTHQRPSLFPAAPPPLPWDAFEILASSRLCKTLLLSQASSVLLHNGAMPLLRSEHVAYGPPPPAAYPQGPSIDNNYKQMGASCLDAAGGGRHWSAEHDAACQSSAAAAAARPVPSSKKPRIEQRSSSSVVPSFKVRKEKLGDRIAALQQLVSPFGKTDTASVLMEAIGYIKFLQDQVETLSRPYLKSSRSMKPKPTQRGSSNANAGEQQEETRLDLRSRGLCLVPLSCTSYVTNENGVWVPPNFRGN